MKRTATTLASLLAAAALAGCLDPLVDDTPAPSDDVLPAGTVLPLVDDDPVLGARLALHDGVDDGGVIPRISGFAGGQRVHTWDVGPAPPFIAPVYVLVRMTEGGPERVAHNTIVDTLPGDPGYSPYWLVFHVVVTDRYQGEVIPSVAAIDEAVARGLVEPPVARPLVVDCPAVAADVRLEVGGGVDPLPPPRRFNVKGRSAAYYDFGLMAAEESGAVGEVRRYRLRREGGEPLSEPVRGVDLTGDGDLGDSNDIHDLGASGSLPVPRCRTVDVAVARDTRSIDDSMDETMAELTSASQLFDPAPVTGTVVAFEVTDDVRHCVVQRTEGSP